MTLLEKLKLLNYNEDKAKALIMSGNVLVNNEKTILPFIKIKENDIIKIKQPKQWVSRGAFKLLKAFEHFDLNINNKICLDVGSSTGGFTEVLLHKKAKKVYALDSGKNQLDYKLRINEKVVVLEKTNFKKINEKMFSEKIDFLCCDVSFISVKRLFNVLNLNKILSTKNELIILIKPQFEAPKEKVEKGGFVKENEHKKIIDDLINYAKEKNFEFIGLIKSPIQGNKSKNTEYLSFFSYRKD